MQIWPAIDLRGGKCVRLQQGDYQRETVFSDDPLEVARGWCQQGAGHLHLVDLDGARDGSIANRALIEAIVGAVQVPCELGGGIRDHHAIFSLLELGLDRLVIGTRALKQPDWFRSMCRMYPKRLALGIDARGGRVASDAWRETSDTMATDFAREFSGEPLAAIIYTDITRDGMLEGPNFDAMAEMSQAADVPVLASGGVTTIEDIERLAQLGLAGCIIGRGLYAGKIRLADALRAAGAGPGSG